MLAARPLGFDDGGLEWVVHSSLETAGRVLGCDNPRRTVTFVSSRGVSPDRCHTGLSRSERLVIPLAGAGTAQDLVAAPDLTAEVDPLAAR